MSDMEFFNFADTVSKALTQADFAAEMKARALAALDAVNINEPAWTEFLRFFAEDAAELAALREPDPPGLGTVTPGIPTTNKAMALASVSTAECTMTTTTTVPPKKIHG